MTAPGITSAPSSSSPQVTEDRRRRRGFRPLLLLSVPASLFTSTSTFTTCAATNDPDGFSMLGESGLYG